jgi:hypothetical protein
MIMIIEEGEELQAQLQFGFWLVSVDCMQAS